MQRCLTVLSLALAASALGAQEPAPDGYREVDYAKVERALKKQPQFTAEPLYAMFVLDMAGTFRVWCALDKSDPERPYYDVLYIDLDGDGDLTERGERFTGKFDERMAKAGMGLTIRTGKIKVPGTSLVHTDFLVSTIRKPGRKGIWFRMKWNGKHEMSGGYGLVGSDTTRWSRTLAAAPILRPNPFGPLSFATWGMPEIVLRPGKHTLVNVIVGNRGHGPDAMAIVDEHFLDLERDELLVTVVAKDRSGAEVTATSRIREHC